MKNIFSWFKSDNGDQMPLDNSYQEFGAIQQSSNNLDDSTEDKALVPIEETKGYLDGGYHSGNSFIEYLSSSGYDDLSAFACICLYKKAMPLFNAVSMRSEAFAQIPIRIKEKGPDGEFIPHHPVLDLLERPNADMSQQELLEQLSSFYDITGEVFIVATGRINLPPLEIMVVSPHLVSFSNTASDQFGLMNVPSQIKVNQANGGQITFTAVEYPNDLGLRFVNETQDAEIWHIRSFNPLRSSTNFRGLSRAQPIWMELQQYVSGNTSNLSNLKRGTRLSMAWINKSGVPLTDDQWARAQEEAKKYSGDANAGGTPVLDGMETQVIQQTNRDMEFQKLQESMLARVSSTYRIPLAILLPSTMTLNNLQTSMLQMFDNGVLPLTSRLYGEMTRMLMPRYKGSENLKLAYNENDISALQIRILEGTKLKSEIDASTIDELRNDLGDEPLASGGNQVYRNASLVAVGDDDFNVDDDDEFKIEDL